MSARIEEMADDDIDNMDFDLPVDPILVHKEAPEKIKSWICLYPLYLNAAKSVKQGRKVSTGHSVSYPAAIYIAEAVRSLGFQIAFEPNKRHPRDPFTFGRIRVQMRTDFGLANARIPSKKSLLVAVSKIYDETVTRLNASNPQIEPSAAASRSELSSSIKEIVKDKLQDAKKDKKKKSKK